MTDTNPHDWPDTVDEPRELRPRDAAELAIATSATAPEQEAAPADGATPLSWSQQALWLLDRITGPGGTCNVAMSARLTGPLRIDALERSLQALVERHDSLRTAFEDHEGQPLQRVIRDARIALPVERLDALPAAQREDALLQGLLRQACVPFDLACAPLVRTRLYRLADAEHVLLVVLHHIVADRWSCAVIARDLGALYSAQLNGADPALPALPCRFPDVARRQRGTADGAGLSPSLEYWRQQLAGIATLELPHDRRRPGRPSHRGDVIGFRLERGQVDRLKSLAHDSGATLYMTLLAAFDVLLMRYSGQSDVAVGTQVAGRHGAGAKELVGHFVNTVVMRTDLGGDPGFDVLLARVRETCLGAYAHQDAPFEMVVRQAAPARRLDRNPLFQVSFALENVPHHTLAIGTVPARLETVHTGTSKFDLSLTFVETEGALHGTLEYSTDLFDRATIERMAGHLCNLIGAIVENPQARLSALPLMGERETRQVLVDWNDTAREFPAQRTLPELFEAQAARAPNATAVVFGHQPCLDYATLNRRANQLAHRLRRLGVGPDVLVALYLQRSPAMIVAMLGILKAGGAYVPIDVDYPHERVAFMLADSAARVTLTERALAPRLADAGTQLLCIDDDLSLDTEPFGNPDPLARPEHLAYVMYTSGSTGKPKGVMIPHRAVARLVCNTDYVRIGPPDCVSQASNASFDAATFEIWGALLNGARLAIVATDTLLSPGALKRQIERDRIDTMWITAALFDEHVAAAPDTFAGVRDLLFGGEAANPESVVRVLRADRPARLVNGYGPTETTTFAACYEVPASLADGGTPAAIPIGRPIANTTCYVLDERMRPVPIGIVGNLWIGGPGLARGYLNRPELDAERFVEAPAPIGARLYRTGDRVRLLADGNIVYLGRDDGQVKLRGFRIELGEIEAALGRLPGVAQRAVIVREHARGDRRLTAYVVWRPGARRLDAAGLRAALAARLPSFMVPAAFVDLDALPLTANGKLDRAALPAPHDDASAAVDDEGDAIERELRTIWESVLGRSDIPLDADFFDLGGHSMLAVRVLAEIDRRMGRQLRTASFFEAPTIRRFAALLREGSARDAGSCVVTIQPGDGTRALFFVSGWGGQLIILNELAKGLGPKQTLHVLDTGAFGADDTDLSIEEVATRMIEDMRQVQPAGPYRLAGYSMGGKIVHEIAQQLHRRGESVALLALLDCSASGERRRHAAPMRVLLHLREAARMNPARMLAYLGGRVRWMIRHLRPRERELFEGDEVVRTALTLAMERSARRMLAAWETYRPRPYPGRVLLVRAEGGERRVGAIEDDDRTYGWGALSGGGVEVRSMQCAHNRMLYAPHAASLARILADAIGSDDAPSSSPAPNRELAGADA